MVFLQIQKCWVSLVTLWDKMQGFEFHSFEPLEDSPMLKPFASLVAIWRSKFNGERIPAWSDFEFTDFLGWHSRIAIYDISFDPFDYVVRLSGEEYNQAFGRNATGMSRETLIAEAAEDGVGFGFYEMTCTEMLMAYTKGLNMINREHMLVEYLELPLSDNGLFATHTIEAIVTEQGKLQAPLY